MEYVESPGGAPIRWRTALKGYTFSAHGMSPWLGTEGVVATIADFLKSIGMAEYAAGLSESGIEVSALQGLTERDLERLGIAPADRDRLLARYRGLSPRP